MLKGEGVVEKEGGADVATGDSIRSFDHIDPVLKASLAKRPAALEKAFMEERKSPSKHCHPRYDLLLHLP